MLVNGAVLFFITISKERGRCAAPLFFHIKKLDGRLNLQFI